LPSEEQRPDLSWFGEGLARIVVSVAPEFVEAWEAYLQEQLPHQWQGIGTVQGESLEIKGILAATVSEMGDRHQQAIPRRLHV